MPGRPGGKKGADYRVIRAQEEERKRLARDLHDGLVGSLVGLGISLEVVERHVTSDPVSKPEALALLARLRERVGECLEEVRRILSDLRPLDLSRRSLPQALKEYAGKVSAEAGFKVTVVVSGQDVRLDSVVEAGLFRIFQEILGNVREHAGAREVSLKLRFLPRSVALDVADDGCGFEWRGDLRELAERRCFGLLGVDERVRLLGGSWGVTTRPGQGTEVRVRVPVESRGGFWSLRPAPAPPARADEPGLDERAQSGPGPGFGFGPGPGTTTGPAESRAVRGRRASRDERAPARVLLADDHRVVREGLKILLDLAGGLEVVGEVADGHETLRLARELSPDVVLLDLVMPGPLPLEVVREIRRRNPGTAVVVLTAYHDPGRVRELLAAGAAGYVLKTANVGEIVEAVRAAASGLRALAPEAVSALAPEAVSGLAPEAVSAPAPAAQAAPASAEKPRDAGLDEPSLPADLTLREREILKLVGEGMTNREIGRLLFISEKTVRNHLAAVLRKLGLDDRTQAALAARGLRPGPGPASGVPSA